LNAGGNYREVNVDAEVDFNLFLLISEIMRFRREFKLLTPLRLM